MRLIAHRRDRAASQPDSLGRRDEGPECDGGIRDGVEDRIEVIIGEGDTVPVMQEPLPPVVAAEDQDCGRLLDPCLVRDQRGQFAAFRGGTQFNDVTLL